MIQMIIPDAKVRASINGKVPCTPKALLVFEDSAKFVTSMYTMVDMGLSRGTLCTQKSIGTLRELLKLDKDTINGTPIHLNWKEVMELYKRKDRVPITLNYKANWQIASAYKFFEACVKTVAGIDLD